MNIDLAIRNALSRGPMESAMHGVVSNYGQSYELHAIPQTIQRAEDMLGKNVGRAAPNILAKASIPWASEVSFVDTVTPSTAPFNAQGAWDSPQTTPFDAPMVQDYTVPNLLSINFTEGRYVFNSYL